MAFSQLLSPKFPKLANIIMTKFLLFAAFKFIKPNHLFNYMISQMPQISIINLYFLKYFFTFPHNFVAFNLIMIHFIEFPFIIIFHFLQCFPLPLVKYYLYIIMEILVKLIYFVSSLITNQFLFIIIPHLHILID